MIYQYMCLNCKHEFETIKSVRQIDDPETCEKCGSKDNRRIITGGSGFFGEKDWDTAQFCPAVGKVIRSNADRKRIAKSMGLTEIGDEPPEKLHRYHNEKLKENLDLDYKKDNDKLNNIVQEVCNG